MNVDEGETVLMLWTASVPASIGRTGDWMCISKRTQAGELKCEYRFRWHNERGFERDADDISRVGFSCGADTPVAREKLSGTIRGMMAMGGFENVTESVVDGGHQRFLDVLMALPGWAVKVTRVEAAR